jgi:hypothetical protein
MLNANNKKMSIIKIPLVSIPELPSAIDLEPNINTGVTQFDISALGAYASYIGQMPSTETIDSVFFRIGTLTTGTSAVVKLEGLNTSTGTPNNILLHPAASALVALSLSGDYTVQYYVPFTIPMGTFFCITIAQSGSRVPSNIRFAYFVDDIQNSGFPYVSDSGTARLTYAPLFGIGLNSISAVPLQFCWPMSTVSDVSINNSSAINCIGNKILINAPVRVRGIRTWIDLDGNCSANLFDVDGTTILRTASAFINVPNATARYRHDLYFSSPITLLPGNTYYAAISATSPANSVTLGTANFPTAAWRTGSPMGGAEVCYTQCKNPVGTISWSDDLTKQAFIGLLVDGIDNSFTETSSVFFA